MIIETYKVVKMIYQAYDNKTGVLLDENIEGKPLELITGKDQLVPGLEKEIQSMNEGDEKIVIVQAKEAYGEKNQNEVKDYPIEQFDGIKLELGMTLASIDSKGNQVYVKVAGFDDKTVKIDFNHPLSGKDIKFHIKILEIKDATEKQIHSGEIYEKEDSCGCGSGCGCH